MQPPSIAPVLADLNAAAERIWEACSPRWPTLSLDVLPEVGSTNTELMDRGRRGETWPTALVAASQTAGRGRRGRSWAAQPGDTLTCSLGLPLQLDEVPGGGSALSLAVGLSLAQSLDRALPARHASGQGPALPPIGLKWPNDLWLGARKLGGILIEATPAPGLPEGRRWVVIGFGLNVRPGQAPAGLVRPRCAQGPGRLAVDPARPGARRSDASRCQRHGPGRGRVGRAARAYCVRPAALEQWRS